MDQRNRERSLRVAGDGLWAVGSVRSVARREFCVCQDIGMTRRELIALLAAAPLARAKDAPTAPVSIARCRTYDGDIAGTLSGMFDQLGGLGRIVKNKTVTIKVNLTGSPGLRFQGKPLGLTHYTHPKMAGAMAYLLERSGARRGRFVESCWGTAGSMEEDLLDFGWNVRMRFGAAEKVEVVNTNGLG